MVTMPLLRSSPMGWPRRIYKISEQSSLGKYHRLIIWSMGLSVFVLALVSLWHLSGFSVVAGPIHGGAHYDGRSRFQTSTARVDLGYASYQGDVLSAGVNQYLGMRFASPPTGDLRWRAPVQPQEEVSVSAANAFGPICIGTSQGSASDSLSEDCLFVNVWTPTNATRTSKLPVWLFVQGGGYIQDSNANYNGTKVVEQSGHNLILVNFNYRVGAYGFLASKHVQADGDLNVGLLDQRMAMLWVQKYIHLFGGDPDRVILHGVSAGAGSVAHHLTRPDEKLFSGAIIESVFFPTEPSVKEREWQYDLFASSVGCSSNDVNFDSLACLRTKDIDVLQNANVPSAYPGATTAPLFYWTPVVDGKFTRDTLSNLFAAGKFINVPILIGDDTDEGSYFAANAATPTEMSTFMQSQYPHLDAQSLAAINTEYPLRDPLPYHAAYFPSTSAAYGEACFICPSLRILDAYSQVQTRLYSYRYAVLDEINTASGLGTPHTFELPAIFGPGYADGAVSYTTYNAPIVPIVMDYFISFVRALDPNVYRSVNAPRWEDWGGTAGNVNGRRIFLQTGNVYMQDLPGDEAERCAFWKGLDEMMQI